MALASGTHEQNVESMTKDQRSITKHHVEFPFCDGNESDDDLNIINMNVCDFRCRHILLWDINVTFVTVKHFDMRVRSHMNMR